MCSSLTEVEDLASISVNPSSVRIEDVDGDEDAAGDEAASKMAGAPASRAACVAASRSSTAMRQVDQHAAGELRASEFADLRALVEAVEQDLVGLEFLGDRLVDRPPEQLGALAAGDEAGLREAVHTD